MLIGFALTDHCNLRCPHCIRDDVTRVRSLDYDLLLRVVDDGLELFGGLTVSFTGGEPTLHPRWDDIIAAMHARGVPYRFVSNGWHMRRLAPGLARHPAQMVRLSLSGATEEVHDAERGRGSFRRVLLGVALLVHLRIPPSLSMVIDRRDRHQLREAADLAEALGCARMHFILPQPVPGSMARDSDIPPGEWNRVRLQVEALASEPHRRTAVLMDYGAPTDGDEAPCEFFTFQRVYVDARGRLALCCQLSEYGFNDREVVADLSERRLREVWPRYQDAIRFQQALSAPRGGDDPVGRMPCIRCARALGKLDWMRTFPPGPWRDAGVPGPALVPLSRA